jgi:hypothetical protein
MATKYTKWQLIDQMAKIFNCQNLQNYPNWDFSFEIYHLATLGPISEL